MKKKSEYAIVEADKSSRLQSKVMAYLEDGYELVGGVSVLYVLGNMLWAQSVVRYTTPIDFEKSYENYAGSM